MLQSRRSFLFGAGVVLITAPAIVRATSIMSIKSFIDYDGVAFQAIEHPWNNLVAHDLNENSILQLMIEIRKDIDNVTGLSRLIITPRYRDSDFWKVGKIKYV